MSGGTGGGVRWTHDEDAALRAACEEHGRWADAAERMQMALETWTWTIWPSGRGSSDMGESERGTDEARGTCEDCARAVREVVQGRHGECVRYRCGVAARPSWSDGSATCDDWEVTGR